MHFHAGRGEKMKRDERQTTRGTHIYGPKRGKRDIMLKKKKKKGEDPKKRFGEKIFNSVKKKKRKEKSNAISGSSTSVFG